MTAWTDPWNVVLGGPAAPKAPAPETRPARINLEDQDFDADLRPRQSCVFRFSACSIMVESTEITGAGDAMALLASCLVELLASPAGAHLRAAGVGVPPRGTQGAPAGSRLECGGVLVDFKATTADQGALAMTRALIRAGRDPRASLVLKRHGITPMLRS